MANNKWAIENFSEWVQARQKKTSVKTSKSYKEILFTDNASELSQWLSAFVKETRKRDGGEYTPKTLYLLMDGLQQEIHLHKLAAKAFNLNSYPQIKGFQNVCDHEFQRLHQKGVVL